MQCSHAMAGKEGHVPTLSMPESLDPYSRYFQGEQCGESLK